MNPEIQEGVVELPGNNRDPSRRNAKASIDPSPRPDSSSRLTMTKSSTSDSNFSHEHTRCHDVSTSTADEESAQIQELKTAGSLLDNQEQDFSTISGTSDKRAREASLNLEKIVRQGFNQMASSLSALSKQVIDQRDLAKLAQLQRELAATTETNHQLKGRQETLEEALEKANIKLEKALQERDIQRRLADGGTLANSRKSSDRVIHSKWKQLDFNICILALQLTKNEPRNRISRAVSMRLTFLSRAWRDHLRDDDLREFLMRGYLWKLVIDEIFEYSTIPSNGRIDHSLRYTEKHMIARVLQIDQASEPLMQRIARWRAQGSALSEELWGEDEEKLNRILTVHLRELRPFWTAQDGSMDRSEVKTSNQMKAILKGAMELERLFLGSKAASQVSMGSHVSPSPGPHQFDQDDMEPVMWTRPISVRSLVIFYTSPALYKLGSADGQNFDKLVTLEKASVVCN
ncbi:hypothetical protein EDB81DRAFT_909511 [Dactylonectria macrodidyma]|uniref:Uncharacterized protein n=1 Tax=Dactylonectria macrodidyma TaxID=307937 RepID=A0A9P9JLS4_9HYPO|nr:hypothetical protein EDB81DRAFT_909511 [Dactylonectria macrodidyma]